MEKRIIHVDMDAFYAQVEQNDNKEYRGKPVIVGGRSFSRGVVSTASYEARKYGVHSAMAMKVAHQKCPDGIFLRARFDRYKEISAQIKEIFLSYTDIVEPLSLDEAYLDITHLVNRKKSARMIAIEIQSKIYETTGLTSSAGVSYNKYLAKIASGMNKPSGTTVIDYDNVQELLWKLEIGEFPGVGKVTEEIMKSKGIYTGKDLYGWSKDALILEFGKRGESLYNKVRGIGTAILKKDRVRQSIGKEITFSYDRNEDEELLRVLLSLSEQVSVRLKERDIVGRVITVKLRNNDFTTHTKQTMLMNPVNNTDEIYEFASKLYMDLKDPMAQVRLIGVTVSGLETRVYRNMTIYDFI
ncbi:DNA polymerase IV [Phocicoccus pinnipedialis]|uniref:DNA polymerase IV n=2 Tax=Phocicoccus pinnipedialis TaxID=110845 RepID=A0A6V7RME7_9BACL|nr:DNA polymerase IV [Jeotgalicoccus pinnipedialis]MBP1940238.1 DNA polymerase-4 [Jeotgalicoccus pinnipedialis]CAD2079553.1 DNA polymerase IV [Jeotgalicoccus pinnipedialis]